MNQDTMQIRIILDINDPFLKSEWERLEVEADIFPQSTYHWCATWWKHLSGRRKLHVVMVVDEEGNALGIAPLCIERSFGIQVLRSFPIHFGDFYTFIVEDGKSKQAVITAIIDHMDSNREWRWIRLEQVPENSGLGQVLVARHFSRKRMTACVIADFTGLVWEDYLKELKKHFRKKVRRRLKKINAKFTAKLRVIRTWEEYDKKFDEMVIIHQERWDDDYSPAKSDRALVCWKEAIRAQFNNGKIAYYQLLFNETLVAYRLGFLHRGMYYAWHTSFNSEFKEFYPGIMILPYMIQNFMESEIAGINFMAGDYDWKLDWSPDRRTEVNYMFTSPSHGPISILLNWYHHRLRDKLKETYHSMMGFKALRVLSKNIIRVKQKFGEIRGGKVQL